jgi:hypothetical protein
MILRQFGITPVCGRPTTIYPDYFGIIREMRTEASVDERWFKEDHLKADSPLRSLRGFPVQSLWNITHESKRDR